MSRKILLHISEKPWGDISESDYTLEQWHNACLIHLHDGPPTSKSQCKLPVRTPSGALNRNGVHAAAAALAGARSPLNAPSEQKAKAAVALRRCYQQLNEDPPESLMMHSVDDILAHFGVKGMKWGVRRDQTSTSGVLSRISGKPELKSDETWRNRTVRSRTADALYPFNPVAGSGWGGLNSKVGKATRKAMKGDIKVLNSKPVYNTRLARREIKRASLGKIQNNKSGVVDKYYAEHSKIFEKHLREQAPKFMQTSPSGKWETKLWVSKSGNAWNVDVRQVDKAKHAADDLSNVTFKVKPIFDNDGFIVDWEFLDSDMAQSAINDILEHFGVKGMKWGVRRAGDHFLERGLAISTPGSRARGAAAAKSARKVKVKDKGKKLRTSGGKGVPAHPDALRAHRIGQVVKKSGTKAVSNQDLSIYANRLQLEQNVSRLTSKERNRGTQFVSGVLSQSGKSLASEAVNKGAKEVGKKALTLARYRK